MGAHIPGITKVIEAVFDGGGEHVVLLDGIAHNGKDMHALGRFLQKEGYRAVSIGYPSTKKSIEYIAEQYIPLRIKQLVPDDGKPVHFITHSMGGIIFRQMHYRLGISRLGRVIMIAPPNQGSPVADQLAHFFVYRWYLGPAGQQLGTGEKSVPLSLPPADYDLGVIAGDLSLDPWFDPFFDEPHDGKISISSTQLKGMHDFCILPYSHYFIHRSQRVHETALSYLREGRFQAL